MADTTEIAWADSTFNPWIGCTKVGPGCDHCYAEADFDLRKHRVKWGAGSSRSRTSAANWKKPLQWNAQQFFECQDCGLRGDARAMGDDPKTCRHMNATPARRRVFCASLADVFDNEVPNEWRADLFKLIADTPHLDWLLLTKRVGNVSRMLPFGWQDFGPPQNAWIGATICNQEEADRDIPKLLAIPARVRFLSMEPLLGPVDFRKVPGFNRIGIDLSGWWVIVGGESGPHARPMHPDWTRSLRDQCKAAGVPFLFKQWGEFGPTWTEANAHRGLAWHLENYDPAGKDAIAGTEFVTRRHGDYEHRELWPVSRHGKRAAGRLLDGVQHNGFPVTL